MTVNIVWNGVEKY